jgi:hypothetical protein
LRSTTAIDCSARSARQRCAVWSGVRPEIRWYDLTASVMSGRTTTWAAARTVRVTVQ